MSLVTLHTQPYSATVSIPNMRGAHIRAEQVVALQVSGQPLVDFRHYRLVRGPEKSHALQLSNDMAERLQRFCQIHYIATGVSFDCRTFLLYMMGWKGGEMANRTDMSFVGVPRNPSASIPGKPYLIPSPSSDEPPHFMLGILRPGYSLGVMGVRGPLLVAKNTELVKIYSTSEIAEITSTRNK